MRKNQGFTLVEVIVAGSIGMILILGMTSMMDFTNKATISVKSSTDFISLVNVLQAILSNPTTCATALSSFPLQIGSTLSPQTPQTPPISPIYLNGPGSPIIAQITPAGGVGPGGNLVITKLEFNKLTHISGNNYVTNLYLEANKRIGNGGGVGTSTLSHDFPLLLTVNPVAPNLITGCGSASSSSGSGNTLWAIAPNGNDISNGNTGNVGIGTAVPNALFSVGNTASTGSGNLFQFGYGFSKTDTTLRRVGTLAQSSDANNPFSLAVSVKGSTTAGQENAILQTGAEPTNNSGNLLFQPDGGYVAVGGTVQSPNPAATLTVMRGYSNYNKTSAVNIWPSTLDPPAFRVMSTTCRNCDLTISLQTNTLGGPIALIDAEMSNFSNAPSPMPIAFSSNLMISPSINTVTGGALNTMMYNQAALVINSGTANSIWASGPIAGSSFPTTSDLRLKKNILDVSEERALDFIKKARPVTYEWKDKNRKGREFGFIAQELLKAGFSEFVTHSRQELKKTVDQDGFESPENTVFSMDYSRLTSVLTRASQYFFEKINLLLDSMNNINVILTSLRVELDRQKAEIHSLREENKSIKAYLCDKDRNAAFCN